MDERRAGKWMMAKYAGIAFVTVLCLAAVLPVNAKTKPFEPGQYQIGDPGIQQICLMDDGTWYGTTFNFTGRWTDGPNAVRLKAVLWGNYRLEGHNKRGYANDSFTFGTVANNSPLIVAWYNWFDDYSYQKVLIGNPVSFIKSDCDPPFTGQNTHAATQ